MEAERSYRSESVAATERFGQALGAGLRPGDVVALGGDLGSGKTALARGIARGLGVSEHVNSPTFALLQEYEGRVPVYHFDAWMAGRELGFLESGGAQLLGGEGVAIVEWAERIEPYLPELRVEVLLWHLGPQTRGLRIGLPGCVAGRLVALLDSLAEAAEEGGSGSRTQTFPVLCEPPGDSSVGSGA